MKKFLIFLLICCFSCQNKEQKKESTEATEKTELDVLKEKICFLSTGNDVQRENSILCDSTILNLKIEGENVTGKLNWIPAEKDSRIGNITAKKSGNLITGNYTFTQEGMEETQSIEIKLNEELASITTNTGKMGEVNLSAKKIDCTD